MDELNGVFDQGFSGILQESSRKTMPDYIEKLAEQEINYEPPKLDIPNIPFDKDSGLSRANELTSDGSRESNIENRFTEEKSQRIAQDVAIKTIDRSVEAMIREQNSFEQIQSALLSKFDKELVFKYFESKIRLILNKYAFLGFENLEEKNANLVEQSKVDSRIRRSTTNDILDKFSKLEYVTSSTVKEYKNLLEQKRPVFVVSKFLFSLDNIKQSYYENKEARVAFQRDTDDKDLTIRDVDNNAKKNAATEKQNILARMFNEYKLGINSKLSRSEIGKKLARTFGYDKFQDFSEKYKDELTRIERFSNRQTFDTNFASSTLQGVEIEPKTKPITIDSKAMTNYAFALMTSGNDLEFVKSSLKKHFGLEATNLFLAEHEYKLQKHYGQLGYLFIDSNIYSSCDEMANAFSKLQHAGSKLIYSLKANSKCTGCSLHNCGTCTKVGLLVSNNPLVRSPRAAKRVFEKAATFVPKTHIDTFAKQLKSDCNLELVSKFALGIQSALEEENKNIGKKASKDRTETVETQECFVSANSYSTDIFDKQSDSKIIDDVLGKK